MERYFFRDDSGNTVLSLTVSKDETGGDLDIAIQNTEEFYNKTNRQENLNVINKVIYNDLEYYQYYQGN